MNKERKSRRGLLDGTLPVGVRNRIQMVMDYFSPCDGQFYLITYACQSFLLVTDTHPPYMFIKAVFDCF